MRSEDSAAIRCAASHCVTQLRDQVNPDQFALLCRALVTAMSAPGTDPVDRTIELLDALAGNGTSPVFMWTEIDGQPPS